MGDRTSASLTIYRIGQRGGSREVREDIAALLREYGLGDEYSGMAEHPDADNLVGTPWVDYEMSIGSMSEIVSVLANMKTPVWFRAQEDAYSPWMGELWMNVPKLGLYHHICDDDGTPMFSDNEVRDIVAARLTDQDPSGRLMELRLGKPWFDALDPT